MSHSQKTASPSQSISTPKATGFTLVEMVVAVTVLALVLSTTTSLIVSLISANKSHVQSMQAQSLAREGIEAMRNIRDSNWLQNQDWNRGETFWGAHFADATADFVVELRTNPAPGQGPWQLSKLVPPYGIEAAKLYLSPLPESGVKYTHSSIGAGGANEETQFSRIIKLKKITADAVQIESRVTIGFGRGAKQVSLYTELTDWK